MNEAELNIIKDISAIFKMNKENIYNKWIKAISSEELANDETQFEFFKSGFVRLLDDFIKYLSEGDIDGYLAGNKLIAKEIASSNISYSSFIKAFHVFEDSYAEALIKNVNSERLLKYIGAIDKLHHDTIAAVSEVFFEIKDATVFALAKLAECRDPETGYHLERTRDYSVALAKSLNCKEEYINMLYKVGPLHDIGKVGVRDDILLKPGALSPDEFKIMQKHTTIGAETIQSVISMRNITRCYLNMGVEIALHHHEKFNGSGYPYGLAGRDIPLSARIFAVVDAYDAITSKRPYKEPLPHDEAVRRIVKDAGTHFDPDIVNAFISTNKTFHEINMKYNSL